MLVIFTSDWSPITRDLNYKRVLAMNLSECGIDAKLSYSTAVAPTSVPLLHSTP